MKGQISIFDWMREAVSGRDKPKGYWDATINTLEFLIETWAEVHRCKVIRKNFSVWSHVPHLGYRYSIDVLVHPYTSEKDIESIVNEVLGWEFNTKDMNTSASIIPYFGDEKFSIETKRLTQLCFSTLYKDERRKISTEEEGWKYHDDNLP